jgi:hypothetical protein
MFVLASVCTLIGLAPMLFNKILIQTISLWSNSPEILTYNLGNIAPLWQVSFLAVVLIVGIVVTFILLRLKKSVVPEVGTWDCGYALPSHKMQYSASSFAHSIITLFHWVLHSREHKPHLTGNFPESAAYSSHVNELVLDRLLIPFSNVVKRCSNWFHRFQQGIVQHYILYILIALFLLLCAQMPIKEIVYDWFVH